MNTWLQLAPALPATWLVQAWLFVGWALVLSAVLLRLTQHTVSAAVIGLLLCWPWQYAPVGFVALAFQSPSVVLVLWAVLTWWRRFHPNEVASKMPTSWAWALVLLGWGLCLDTLNLWPQGWSIQLFAFGFEPASLVLVLVVGLVWVALASQDKLSRRLKLEHPTQSAVFLSLGVLAVYVVLRVPTGNVWDALLDPFVWLALHGRVWRSLRA